MATNDGTGNSGSDTGIEIPISINSNDRQTIVVTDLLSEGPIHGLVQGAASVFLDNDRIVEPSVATERLSTTAVTITLTQGSSTATVNNSNSTEPVTMNPEAGGTTNLVIRNGMGSTNVTVTQLGRGRHSVTTSSSFFTDAMISSETRVGTLVDIAPARLIGIAGTSSTPQGIPIEGHLSKRESATKALWQTGIYGDPMNYRIPESTYVLELDDVVTVSSVNGTTITLSSNWTGSSGTYFFDKLGSLNLQSTLEETQQSQRVEGASVKFRVGNLYQSPLSGNGSTAITTSLNLSLEQTSGYGSGSQAARELTGSGNIGLSTGQLEEVDKVKFRITYPGGFKGVGGQGGDNTTYIRYKIDLAIKREASDNFGSFIVIRPALVHSGNYSNSRTFEHKLSLERFRPFVDFKIRISRLDSHESDEAYKAPGERAKSDWTNVTQGAITGTTCILNEKLNHPYTALAETTFSTKEFSSTPQRTFHLRGKLVRVPSNYVTREESSTGIANYNRNVTSGAIENTYQDWDGNFRTKLIYTNNPAWIYFDILTNNRYGLGDFIDDLEIDKFSLYRIARYCDGLVSDGKGGQEPRYTLNTHITKQTDCYKVLKDLATNFLGLLYFLDGKIFPSIDSPASPVYNFSKANVLDGQFSYETTGTKTRVNQVVVSWNNPDNNYALEPLIVEDSRNIAQTQTIITQDAVAYGCTSEAQATRYGRWKLWTAANQREIISFSTGINGSYITPGDIINVQDSDRHATRYGGRVSNTGTRSQTVIPLDSTATLLSGSTYKLSIVFIQPAAFALEDMTINSVAFSAGDLVTEAFIDSNGDGTYTLQNIDSEEDAANAKGTATATTSLSLEWKDHIRTETKDVNTSSGSTSILTVASPGFSETVTPEHMWVLTETKDELTVAGSAKEYRVLSIAQNSKNEYDITAVEHYDSKYSSIEEDFTTYVAEALAPIVTPTDIVPPVTGLAAKIVLRQEGSSGDNVVVSWDAPAGESKTLPDSTGGTSSQTVSSVYEHLHGFFVEHNFPNYESPLRVSKDVTIFTFENVPQGTFNVSVRAMNILENKSVPKTINVTSTDRFEDNLNRMPLGVPYGGLCSTITTLSSSGLFSFDDNVYGFKPLQTNSARVTNTSTNTNTFQLNINGLPTITWTAQTESGEFIHQHHYMAMRSDVTSNMLKLLKYNRAPSHGVPYWFDAGNGSETTGLTALTGTLVASSEGKVTGSGTAFTTELQVGELIVVGSNAARVSSIKSDTIIYVDRALTVSQGASASTNNYHFDFTNDTIIARVYKETNAGYQAVSFISLDTTLSPQLGATRFLYALVTNNGSAPAYNASAGTFADPAAGAATGWQLSVPTTTSNGDLIYAIQRVLTSDGKSPQDATWSSPFIYASRQDGERGAGRWHISVSSLPTTSSAANTAWNTGSGNQPSTAVVGDQAFFYTGTLASPTAQKVWIYAGSNNWTEQTEVIDGDLLVQGTVTADAMNVSTLSSMTANIGAVTAGTIKGGDVPDANAAPSGSETGAFMDLTNGKMVFGNASKHILFDGTNLQLSGVTIDANSIVNSTAGVIIQEDGSSQTTAGTTLNFTTGLDVAVTGSAPSQTATISLDSGFATLNGSTFTGSVLLPDQTSILPSVSSENYVAGTGNNNLAATTRYVEAAITSLINGAPGTLNTLNELAEGLNDDDDAVATINTALTNRLRVDISSQNLSSTQKANGLTNLGAAPLASPALTGTPTAPTATSGTNTTQIATTAFVQTAASNAASGAVSGGVNNGLLDINEGNLIDLTISGGDFTANKSSETDITINVDLSELTDMTDALDTSEDEFVLLDNGNQKRKLASEIFGSNAFNSTAFTTNTGTVTSVSGTAPVVSSGGTTPAISVTTAAVADGGASLATGDQIHTFVTGQGFITDVVQDTSPQLGGNLDVQAQEINTSTTNGNIKLNPNGTGYVEIRGDGTTSGTTGAIQLNCSNNNHGVKIQSPPHSAGASYTITLPTSDGNANQVLQTDGSGVTSWVDQTSGGVSSISAVGSSGINVVDGSTSTPEIGTTGNLNTIATASSIPSLAVDFLEAGTINANHITADTINATHIDANAVTAEQLQISNNSSGSAGIFMDYNGGSPRIDIRDSSALRVRIGYLA